MAVVAPPAPVLAPVTWTPPVSRRTWVVRHWPVVLASVAFALYAAVGAWLIYRGQYAVGDALVRTANARVILFGRDPHLAALGAVWMPLPVLAQLPLMAVLHPLGMAALVLPLSSAIFAALTVPVLVRVGRLARLPDAYCALVVALYAFNPVIVFWAGSGMSESASFLFLSLTGLTYLRWRQRNGALQLGAVGLSLAMLTMTRYEGIAVTAIVVTLVALQSERGQRVAHAVAVGLPAAFTLFVWLAAEQILLGDAFYWYKSLQLIGTPPAGSDWLPRERTLATSLGYVFDRVFVLAPVALLVTPMALWEDGRRILMRRRIELGAGVVAVLGAFFPALVAYLLLPNKTYGNARYFLPAVVMSVVAGMWVVRPGGSFGTRGWRTGLAAALVVTLIFGTRAQLDPDIAVVESEHLALRRVLGLDDVPPENPAGYENRIVDMTGWKSVARYIDDTTTDDDVIAIDMSAGFPALVFTEHPDRWAVPEDRSFDQELQLTRPSFTVVVLATGSSGEESPRNDELRLLLSRDARGQRWAQDERTGDLVEIWRLLPATTLNTATG